MTHDPIPQAVRYEPGLRQDAEVGPPDAIRGFDCVIEWIRGGHLALALRCTATSADVRAALYAYPELLARLRPNPGPYAQYVAEADAKAAMNEIDELILGAAPSPRRR